MSKTKLCLVAVALSVPILALGLPPQGSTQEDMARKMEATCTSSCHGPALIAQQRLDRNGWTREIDKMVRWGAVVSQADREPLIDYLTRTFNVSRAMPNSSRSVPAGKGSDLYQLYCLGCHDEKPIIARRLDKAGWTNAVDRMIRWGAYVPSARKSELIDYLTMHYGNATTPPESRRGN